MSAYNQGEIMIPHVGGRFPLVVPCLLDVEPFPMMWYDQRGEDLLQNLSYGWAEQEDMIIRFHALLTNDTPGQTKVWSLHEIDTCRSFIHDDIPHKESSAWGSLDFPKWSPPPLHNKGLMRSMYNGISFLGRVYSMSCRSPYEIIIAIRYSTFDLDNAIM